MQEFMQKYSPFIMVVLEIHTSFQSVQLFWKNLGYFVFGIEEARGFVGVVCGS